MSPWDSRGLGIWGGGTKLAPSVLRAGCSSSRKETASISSCSQRRWERDREPGRILQGAGAQAAWGCEEILSTRTPVSSRPQGGQAHHFHEEGADVEVGVLPEVLDDTGLHRLAPALHHQARGGHAGQLVALHVPKTPCQDLGVQSEESSWKGPRPGQGWARKGEAPTPTPVMGAGSPRWRFAGKPA